MSKETLKSWIEANPLRKFRKEQGLSIMAIANMLGVGMSTIQTWESGAHWPKDENFDRMSAIMQKTNLEQSWSKWLQSRPVWTNCTN
jgi:DNA-binding transcriptional regulator YiaG